MSSMLLLRQDSSCLAEQTVEAGRLRESDRSDKAAVRFQPIEQLISRIGKAEKLRACA